MIWDLASQSVKRGTKSGRCDWFAIRDAFLAHRVVCVAPVMDLLVVGCISVWRALFNLCDKIQVWMGCIVWLKNELWIVAVICRGPYKSASLAWKFVWRMPWKSSNVVVVLWCCYLLLVVWCKNFSSLVWSVLCRSLFSVLGSDVAVRQACMHEGCMTLEVLQSRHFWRTWVGSKILISM